MSANTVPKMINPASALHQLSYGLDDLNHESATPFRYPEDIAACEYDPAAMQRVMQCIDNYTNLRLIDSEAKRAVRASEMRLTLLLMTDIRHADSGPLGAHPRLLEQMLTKDPDLVRCYSWDINNLFELFSTSLLAMDVLLQKGANSRLAKSRYIGLDFMMIAKGCGPETLARVIMRHTEEQLTQLQASISELRPADLEAKLARLTSAEEIRNTILARKEEFPAFAGAGIINKRAQGKKSPAGEFIAKDGDTSNRRRVADLLGARLVPISEPQYIAEKTNYLDWMIRMLDNRIRLSKADSAERKELTQRCEEAQAERGKLPALQPPAQPAPGGGHAGGAPRGP